MPRLSERLTLFLTAFNRFEPRLFMLVTSLHLLIIILPTWFFTYDGPAHLHNAWLLYQRWLFPDGILNDWYILNTASTSNWLYYLLTAPLFSFMGFPQADKLVNSLYVLCFAHGFRYFLRNYLQKASLWWTWLIFFFIFHLNYLMGQYNFAWSIALIWWILGMVVAPVATQSWRRWALVLLLMWLSFSAHLLGFLFSGLLAGIFILSAQLKWQTKIQNLTMLGLISAVPLWLVWLFWEGNQSGQNTWTALPTLVNDLISLRVFKVYHLSKEAWFTIPLSLLLGSSILLNFTKTGSRHLLFGRSLAVLVLLLLYFSMPEATAGASFINSRLAMFSTLLLLLLAIPNGKATSWQKGLLALTLIGMIWRMGYFIEVQLRNQAEYASFQVATKTLPEGAIIQQLNFSKNWQHHHLTEGIFVKDIIHLNNYEAYNNYFPLLWQADKYEQWSQWAKAGAWPPCLDRSLLLKLSEEVQPDFFLCWHLSETDPACRGELLSWLQENYTLTHTSSDQKLEIWGKR